MKNILVYSDSLASTEYSPSHPFKPARARQMLDLLERYTLIHENNQQIVEPETLDRKQLHTFHTADYIEALEKTEKGEMTYESLKYSLGTGDNPVFKGMNDLALKASGATYKGAELILSGDACFCFNPVGGFHHAMRSRAGGFCYVNDIAIAIIKMLETANRIAYIDIDVHHGDGLQDAFYSDPRVLTISIHESGRSLFPGTGFEDELGEGDAYGYNVNIPLLNQSDDEVYMSAFNEVVPPLLKKFNPEIVVLQTGGDGHRDDPLANLNLTTNSYTEIYKSIKDLSPKILAAGGGGYNFYKTAVIWALAWAGLCGLTPRDYYAGAVGGMMFGPETEAGSLYDEPFLIGGSRKDECMKHAEKITEYIKKHAFPVFGI